MAIRLKELRKARGISQEALAAELGVRKSAISKWETGRAQMTLDRLEQVAAILGCTPVELLGYAPLLDSGETELLDLFRAVPKERQDRVLKIFRALIEDAEAEK